MNDMDLRAQLATYLNRFGTFAAPPRAVVFPGGRGRRLHVLAALALVAVVVAILAVPIVLAIQHRQITPAGPPKPTAMATPGPPVHHNGQIVIGKQNQLVAMDAATGSARALFTAQTQELVVVPTYSPDGRDIAYLQVEEGRVSQGSIWILDTSTGHARQLTTCTGCGFSDAISWSPDGSRLVYSEADQRGSLQLHLIDADGTHATQLTHFPAAENAYQPAWSPDGTRIAFTFFTIGTIPNQGEVTVTVNLDVINTDGTGLAVLTALNDQATTQGWVTVVFPTWSPNGSRIAYVLDPPSPDVAGEGEYQLWVIDPDGSHRTEIFRSDGCCRGGGGFAGPAWSPDGTRIAGEVMSTLWEMNIDGSSPRSLDGASGGRLTWQPVP